VQVSDNLLTTSQKRLCRYESRNFLQALGRPLGFKPPQKATFHAVPRKRNGLDTAQDGYCSDQS